jgi:hypothetical protein
MPKPDRGGRTNLWRCPASRRWFQSARSKLNIHVITWKTPEAEAVGMAAAIVKNIEARPNERHLAMVMRRQFGYWLREKIAELNANLRVELGFSEGLLESWAAREAFILFCLSSILTYQHGELGSAIKTRTLARTSMHQAEMLPPI